MEEADGEQRKKRAESLIAQFSSVLAEYFATYHTLTQGEAKGKASNETCVPKMDFSKS